MAIQQQEVEGKHLMTGETQTSDKYRPRAYWHLKAQCQMKEQGAEHSLLDAHRRRLQRSRRADDER